LWKAPVFEPDRGCCAIRTAAQADFRAANLDFAVAVVICFSNGDSRKLDGVMAREPVLAAGGIVLRHEPTPLIAVVRLRKRDEWVLPKGKLDDGETPLAAAKREVLEETGHVVTVHEFLGTLVYEISGRSKVVHYWRMEARGGQTHQLMNDIRAVDWLPLEAALERLSRISERAFLANVGPQALLNLSRRTKAKALMVRKRRDRNPVVPGQSPPPSLSESLPAPVQAEAALSEAIVPPLAVPGCEPAAGEPVVEEVIVVEPAVEAIVSELTAPLVEVECAPQTEGSEATVDATAPAPRVDAEAASVFAAAAADDRATAAADGRRWSLARRVRDWLGLAA
jgi:8-oxo-dGTP diphosphatase